MLVHSTGKRTRATTNFYASAVCLTACSKCAQCIRVLEQNLPGLEKLERQAIFKPIVGIIVNLCQQHNTTAHPSTCPLLSTFARHPLLAVSSFAFICGFKWQWGSDIVPERGLAALEQFKTFTELMEKARSEASSLGDELGEIPEEFLDPITMELMEVRSV